MIPAPRQGWPWALALVAALIVGASVGAYGWSTRDHAAAPADAELVAGAITVQGSGTDETGAIVYDVMASVFNLNDADVTVVRARHTGWTVARDQPRTTLPGRQWAAVRLTITPDCEVPPVQELELELDRGSQLVTLPVRTQSSDTHGLHNLVCSGQAPGVRVLVEAMELTAADGVIDMRIPLRATAGADSDEITLIGLDASTAGFHAAALDLPIRLRPGHTATVTLRWSAEDCTAIDGLGDVQLSARTASGDNLVHPLPGRAVAALARLGVEACSS